MPYVRAIRGVRRRQFSRPVSLSAMLHEGGSGQEGDRSAGDRSEEEKVGLIDE